MAGLWICLEIIGSFFKLGSTTGGRATEAAAVQAAASPADDSNQELFAVIAAAIDTAISQPHQIVSISSSSPAGGEPVRTAVSEGRRDIYRTRTLR